jgi:hypothetical protein
LRVQRGKTDALMTEESQGEHLASLLTAPSARIGQLWRDLGRTEAERDMVREQLAAVTSEGDQLREQFVMDGCRSWWRFWK